MKLVKFFSRLFKRSPSVGDKVLFENFSFVITEIEKTLVRASRMFGKHKIVVNLTDLEYNPNHKVFFVRDREGNINIALNT